MVRIFRGQRNNGEEGRRMGVSSLARELQDQILDGTKISWYHDRVRAWERGEKIAPVTIDMALTRTCNFACQYCYATLQENQRYEINQEVMRDFLDDAAEIGVKGVSLVSDGESTLNPAYEFSILYGHSKGLAMASGTNAYLLRNEDQLRRILPCLTYLRINITAGESGRYKEIMGVKDGYFEQVCANIKLMARIKREMGLSVTIGLQMVFLPSYVDQVIPLAKLGAELGADYLVIKHCSDDETGSLGVNYDEYKDELIRNTLKEAEKCSNDSYLVKVKWSKIEDGNIRSYSSCYGTPFLLQISGSGLVAPCGMLFGEKYKRYHIGNITQKRFREIYQSEEYWEVVRFLASDKFNAQKMCGSLCLQHSLNKALDNHKKGRPIQFNDGPLPPHGEFV